MSPSEARVAALLTGLLGILAALAIGAVSRAALRGLLGDRLADGPPVAIVSVGLVVTAGLAYAWAEALGCCGPLWILLRGANVGLALALGWLLLTWLSKRHGE